MRRARGIDGNGDQRRNEEHPERSYGAGKTQRDGCFDLPVVYRRVLRGLAFVRSPALVQGLKDGRYDPEHRSVTDSRGNEKEYEERIKRGKLVAAGP